MKKTKRSGQALSLIILMFNTCLMVNLHAQNNFWTNNNAYLGQRPPGDTPTIFAKGMLADSGIVLGRVAFSKEGKTFYYGFARHWFDFNGTGIKEISFDGKKWSRPKLLVENLATPTLSVDGTKLLMGGQNSDVWQSERVGSSWSTPKLLLDKKYGLYNFMPTNSGIYYVGSNANAGNKRDYSTYDFCTLSISGNDTVIKSLGSPLNTTGFDGDFFIAPDESYIIISAKETKTYECELWISFRKADKTWTNPESLGNLINHGAAHRFGQYVSPDGRYLFYTKGTGEKDCNFYWVRFDHLLKKLKNEIK
ncbi:MAG: hypothetical protein ABI707_01305 [Ferruginibacter sp.]